MHLTVGSVYIELAGYNKALDSFQHAHRIAQTVHDRALELQVKFISSICNKFVFLFHFVLGVFGTVGAF